MPQYDQALAHLVLDLEAALKTAGLVRQRGGITRGIAWAECSGRLARGGWAELRLHHRPAENLVQAGLLVYEPLSRGGRTVPVGDGSWSYQLSPSDVVPMVAAHVDGWLETLANL